MITSTFSVFVDENVSPKLSSKAISTSRKGLRPRPRPESSTKENINPLTGECFDSQAPVKKRKPSSSSALKVKALPSTSKPLSKPRKMSPSASGKVKGKKRAVLGSKVDKNAQCDASDEQTTLTVLGNSRSYDFTVMPLADVTQAYDESEAIRATVLATICESEAKPIIKPTKIEKFQEESVSSFGTSLALTTLTWLLFRSTLIWMIRHPRKALYQQLSRFPRKYDQWVIRYRLR